MNIWHERLRHPNERTIKTTWNIAEKGLDFTNSLTAYDICNIKSIKQKIRNKPGKIEIMEWL